MPKVFVKKILLPAGIIALFFAACSDSNDGGTQPASVASAETIEDLPNCSKSREGDSMLVAADSLTYICHEGSWKSENNQEGSVDEGSKTPDEGQSSKSSPKNRVESMDDLPNCSKNREGDSLLVAEDSLTYICRRGKWEKKKYMIDSVKTEDDLPACTKGYEGDSAYVSDEYAIYVCIENMWKKDLSIVQVYKSADDMPSCTPKRANVEVISTADSMLYRCDGERWQEVATTYASEDNLPNCTDKREGNLAYLQDTRERFRCSNKQWVSVEL